VRRIRPRANFAPGRSGRAGATKFPRHDISSFEPARARQRRRTYRSGSERLATMRSPESWARKDRDHNPRRYRPRVRYPPDLGVSVAFNDFEPCRVFAPPIFEPIPTSKFIQRGVPLDPCRSWLRPTAPFRLHDIVEIILSGSRPGGGCARGGWPVRRGDRRGHADACTAPSGQLVRKGSRIWLGRLSGHAKPIPVLGPGRLRRWAFGIRPSAAAAGGRGRVARPGMDAIIS